MKILWFTWRDRKHPLSGGAEVVNEEIAKRFARDGHEVIFLVGGFKEGIAEEEIDGYRVVRLGNRWSVYWKAYRYYKKNLYGWADVVIDEMNTVPFFCRFYVKEKNFLLAYQLCREIWFYEMFFPLSLIGYILEPIYLWSLRRTRVLTESESAKLDLQRYGFRKENIFVFPIGLDINPLPEEKFLKETKETNPTLLYFGSIRPMKRPDHVLRAFEIAKTRMPDLKLWIAGGGSGKYYTKLLRDIEKSRYRRDITYHGRCDMAKKLDLMQRAHLICVTSLKEGWGLIVTEAASQGTPAVVYNVDGLRDSVRNGKTGFVCEMNTPGNMAEQCTELLGDTVEYERLRRAGWEWSKDMNFENSYKQFTSKING